LQAHGRLPQVHSKKAALDLNLHVSPIRVWGQRLHSVDVWSRE
jgi:hypothetical protein